MNRSVAGWIRARFDKSARRELERESFRASFPRAGFLKRRMATRFVDRLTDAQLDELNAQLDWNCFTVDAQGRRFGAPAKPGKRGAPEQIPDPRIALLDRRFGLRDKSVLEIGCFEGIHTIALCRVARAVTAIDARVENVVKTIVRCAFFGERPVVFPFDVESAAAPPPELECDVVHHVGVLYHLKDPVAHLLRLGPTTRVGIMLDTHYAEPEQATLEYEAGDLPGRRFAYREVREDQPQNVFAGTQDHAKWLTLAGLREALGLAGFAQIDAEQTRVSRNGPRVLLLAARS